MAGTISRRKLMLGAAASAAGATLPGVLRAQVPTERFSMKFAPHPGMQAGDYSR